jgi:hypothetical protein
VWLTIYNANFDPLRPRSPKSLTLAVLLVPLCVINTRVIGRGKWHFTSVAPFGNPSLFTETCITLVILALAYRSNGFGAWTDATLRALPVCFALLQYTALTPILLDSKKQHLIMYIGALLDTVLYLCVPVWGVAYGGVLACRVIWWAGGILFEILRWIMTRPGVMNKGI